MSPVQRLHRTLQRADQRLSLLGVFLIVSAVILACAAVVLGSALNRALYDQTVGDARRTAEHYVNGLLRASAVRDDHVVVAPHVPPGISRDLAEHASGVVSVKVWNAEATLAWTQLEPDRIGRRYTMSAGLRAALRDNRATSSFVSPGDADDRAEHRAESSAAPARLLELYTPIHGSRGQTIGSYEVYVDAHSALDQIAAGRRLIWIVTAGVFVVLWFALALLVRGASRRLRRQTLLLRERSGALAEAYGALEQRSLEAIESLNATIEARDPSGAGRSAGVQRIALVVGRELGLHPDELDALSRAALLHNIGNIAVPDAVLAKPGPLTAAEYEQVKLHADEGAAILDRFSPLVDVVPIVRHHHERWDGAGYPGGLARDRIPIGAAIVAVAEAWTAMTSDRPYRFRLTPEEAMAELVAGRGTQFSPQVVDAFLRAAGQRGSELWARPVARV